MLFDSILFYMILYFASICNGSYPPTFCKEKNALAEFLKPRIGKAWNNLNFDPIFA